MKQSLEIKISGIVQGVGFRPFVYNLAKSLSLQGTVQNTCAGVLINVTGEQIVLENFIERIKSDKPVNSGIDKLEISNIDPYLIRNSDFRIADSNTDSEINVMILPDLALCDECLTELYDPDDRRYLYPFINCIHCGPRFSIIEKLPYDRCNTSMKKFQMCEKCRKEYDDPSNRRFHAQPVACPECGPQVSLWTTSGKTIAVNYDALLQTTKLLKEEHIIALKGLGGFQLLADAGSDEVTGILRHRKYRDEKPFAVMFPDITAVKDCCNVSEQEEKLLTSVRSPIVLLEMKSHTGKISPLVNPHNPYLGVMLPYTPLHHLLMKQCGIPLIATSGNFSEEPMCTDEHEAIRKLNGIADYFLVHDRPIARCVDDSVVRVVFNKEFIIRRARGYAPLPVELSGQGKSGRVLLSLGGHLKNTVSLKKDNNIFISQHIGDLSNHESFTAFNNVITDLSSLYSVKPDIIVCDKHPDYLSTQKAKELTGNVIQVQHHMAHIASAMLENKVCGKSVGIAWDGAGYGSDGTLWGSEFFLCDGYTFSHAAQFRRFQLPGGESASKDTRRSALGVLYEIYGKCNPGIGGLKFLDTLSQNELRLFNQMLHGNINSPVTSSAGRLFDAVAAITGVSLRSAYEGHSAMMLEFAADTNVSECYDFQISKEKIYIIDWQPFIEGILQDVQDNVSNSLISGKFHNTLVKIILVMVQILGLKQVIISGGCFQNKLLLEKTIQKLNDNNFYLFCNHEIPANDGGLSAGQAAIAMQL